MTRLAQLTVAELLARGVPLTATEAAALIVAVSAALDAHRSTTPCAFPRDEEILLSSTGQVAFECAKSRTGVGDQTAAMAALLHRLLRLDEADGDRRAHVPGGLLVLLARALRQIDAPPLSAEGFFAGLSRFSGSADSSVLAAVFWRAARMRPQARHRLAAGRGAGSGSTVPRSRSRPERRTHGPTPEELRSWLRQAERDLFRARQSRAAAISGAVAATLALVAVLGIGASLGTGQPEASHVPQKPSGSVSQTAVANASHPRAARLDAAGGVTTGRSVSHPARSRRAAAATPTARSTRRQTAVRSKSVHMVNLPRATWATVR